MLDLLRSWGRLSLALLPLLLAPGARGDGPEPDAPPTRSPRCAALERVLGVLEWQRALDGPAAPRSFTRSLREQAIRQLTRSYADACVALNQIQVLGTHNSYHVQPDPILIDIYVGFDPRAIQWEYTHVALDEQFSFQGIRQIELDVYADPDGGLFSEPAGLQILLGDATARIPELDAPGLKVLHVPELDYVTTCLTLVECLGIVKGWSDANPAHLPLMILIEAKEDFVEDPTGLLGFTEPLPFGPAELDEIDREIRSVLPAEQLITPDDVRGDAATLEDAVLARGWPTLAASRGRILFALDNGGATRLDYLGDAPNLKGRVLFTNAVPGDPDAAFVKVNDPLADPARIPGLVQDGYIVRTRADADTLEARANDPTRRDAALASGAQFVSTDYPVPDPALSDYQVVIPEGSPARCNPVNAPPGCRSFALEALGTP